MPLGGQGWAPIANPDNLVNGGYADCTAIRVPDCRALCTDVVREMRPGDAPTPMAPYFADQRRCDVAPHLGQSWEYPLVPQTTFVGSLPG